MPAPVFDEQAAAEPEPEAAPTRRWTRKQLAIALVTGVAAAAVTVGLVTTLAGSNTKPRAHKHAAAPATQPQRPTGGGSLKTPAQPCQQTVSGCSQTTAATPTITGPYADWMGMQIVTTPSGVVVDTVKLGSPGDQAGFEPGDQIMSVDTHVLGTVSQLRADTDVLHVGDKVTVAVLRQSVQLTFASIPMTERPTIHP